MVSPSAQLVLHLPFWQTRPASHSVAQSPQWFPSWLRLTQASPQSVRPSAQRTVHPEPLQIPGPLPLLGAGQSSVQLLQSPSVQVFPSVQSASPQQPLSGKQPFTHSFSPTLQAPALVPAPPATP